MPLDPSAALGLVERWGYVIVFFAALLEAMPLVGLFVPGQAVLAFAGFSASRGHLSLAGLIAVAFAASLLGDAVGYHLGSRKGRPLIQRFGPRFGVTDAHLAKADGFLERYGPAALIVARFSFLTRGLAPFLAGMHGMRLALFWSLNLLGGLLWAATYGGLGFVAGESLGILERFLGRAIAAAVVVAVGLYLTYRLFRRYAPDFTRADAALALVGGAAALAFARLVEVAAAPGPSDFMDGAADGLADALVPFAAPLRVAGTLASYAVLLPATLLVIGYLVGKRRAGDALAVAIGMAGEEELVAAVRAAVFPPFGPLPGEALATTSFPSAHSAGALIFAGLLLYLFLPGLRSLRARTAVAGATGVLVLAAGLSRVAARTHYPTDVLGGYLLGAAWLCAVLLFAEFLRKRPKRRRARGAGAAAGSPQASSGDASPPAEAPAAPAREP